MIELHKATGKNFLLYDSLEIDLKDKGLVCLSARRASNKARSNGGGKTSALKLIRWIIWGVAKDNTDVDSVVKWGANECEGFLEGTIYGNPFWVRRVRKSSGGTTLRSSLSGASRTPEVQADLDKHFGTSTLAENTVFLAQSKALEFLSAKDANRRRIMEELLKVSIYRRTKDVESDLKWARNQLVSLEHSIKVSNLQLEAILTKRAHAKERAVSEVQSKIDLLESQADKARDMREILMCELDAYDEAMLEVLHEYTQTKLKYECLNDSCMKIANRVQELGVSLATSYEILKNEEAGVCPTCGREYEEKHDVHVTTVDMEMALAEKEMLISSYDPMYAELQQLNDQVHTKEVELNRLNKMIETHRAKIGAEEHTIYNTVTEITGYELQKNSIESVQNTNYDEEIEILRHTIATDETTIKSLEYGVKIMKLCQEGFSATGVSAMLTTESLPTLVESMNKFLWDLSNHELVIDILPAGVNKQGTVYDELTFVAYDEGKKMTLNDASVGQQRTIVLALFFALADVQYLSTGVSWNCRFFDELFDSLDQPAIEAAMKAMKLLKVPTIILTSHRTELAGMEGFTEHWIAERGPKGSRLITGKEIA